MLSAEDEQVALAMMRRILGPNRKAMPCGCIMTVVHKMKVDKYPYQHYSVLTRPVVCCNEHVKGCPHIGVQLNE